MKNLLIALLVAGGIVTAEAQLSSVSYTVLTNLPAIVQTNTATALTATTNNVPLWSDSGIGISFKFTVSNTNGAGTGNAGLWVQFSPDGTNYPPVVIPVLKAANAGTSVTVNTNFSAAYLAGFSSMTVNITNSNEQLTNGGVIVYQWRAPGP